MDPLDFTGRAVVVTGGTRGIGAAIAAAFHAAGADVLICGRTPPAQPSPAQPSPAQPSPAQPPPGPHAPTPAAATSSSAASPPQSALPVVPPPGSAAGLPSIEFFQADVRDPAQVVALIGAAHDRFGRLDVVINNAGGSPQVPAATASPRLHAKIIELNLIAPLHVAQAANAVMREQDSGGVILMIGSVSGTRPSPGTAAYGAAKAGLHHLATSLAAEWAPKVRVNSLVVGPVEATSTLPAGPVEAMPTLPAGPAVKAAAGSAGKTMAAGRVRMPATASAGMPGSADGDLAAGPGERRVAGEGGPASTVARTVPMGRGATAAEVASACLLLASPLAGYISGASLAVHGGGEWPAYLADVRDTAYRAQK